MLELLLGLPEGHGEGGELGLRAVMQVTFDPAQRGGRVVDHLGAGGFEFAQPLIAFGLPEQAADQQPVQRGKPAYRPGRDQQDDDPGRHEQHGFRPGVDEAVGAVVDGQLVRHVAVDGMPLEHERSKVQEGVLVQGAGPGKLPPERVGQPEQAHAVERQRHVEADERQREFHHQVGPRPPADRIGQRGLQPPEKAAPADERARLRPPADRAAAGPAAGRGCRMPRATRPFNASNGSPMKVTASPSPNANEKAMTTNPSRPSGAAIST